MPDPSWQSEGERICGEAATAVLSQPDDLRGSQMSLWLLTRTYETHLMVGFICPYAGGGAFSRMILGIQEMAEFLQSLHGHDPICDCRRRGRLPPEQLGGVRQQGVMAFAIFIGRGGEIELPCVSTSSFNVAARSSVLKGGLRFQRASITLSTSSV